MGLESFGRFQQLRRHEYVPSRIGFSSGVDSGTINRLHARINVAKSFRGIELEGINEKTVQEYSAFFQVFLTHSALEQSMKLYGIKNVSGLSEFLAPYSPEKVVAEFFELDEKYKLYKFLCKHIDVRGKKVEEGLTMCKRGESTNVAYVSAAVRHIFVHGHLSANADGINPRKVYKACISVSDFLLRFMDAEFTKKIDACYERIRAKEEVRQS